MFSVYETLFTSWENNEYLTKKIPYTGGLEVRTIYASLISGVARAVAENPFEYAKVKQQTKQ